MATMKKIRGIACLVSVLAVCLVLASCEEKADPSYEHMVGVPDFEMDSFLATSQLIELEGSPPPRP